MSSTLDTAITIALFVVGAPLAVALVPAGFFYTVMDNQAPDQPPWRLSHKVLGLLAFVIPPTLLLGIYVAAIALAWFASGLTFYYPLAALAVGFTAWYFALESIPKLLRHLLDAHMAGYVKVQPDALTADEAVAAVREYVRRQEIDYPTEDLAADRFPLGWSVYAPRHVGRPVFLIGDSGRIERTSSSVPPEHAQRRFTAQESAIVRDSGKWIPRQF
jgi:hypothetical protein